METKEVKEQIPKTETTKPTSKTRGNNNNTKNKLT